MEQREKGTATFSRLRTPTFPEGKDQASGANSGTVMAKVKNGSGIESNNEVQSNENNGFVAHPLENINKSRGSTKKKKKYV